MVGEDKKRLTIEDIAESGQCPCPDCSSQDFKTEEVIIDTFLDAILDRIEIDKKQSLILPSGVA